MIDDIDHSLAFRTFVSEAKPQAWLAARHVLGPGLMGPDGLWGLAVKSNEAPGLLSERLPVRQRRAARTTGLRAIEASPHYRTLRALTDNSTLRDRRHGQIELSVTREIALLIRWLARAGGRLLQIQPLQGPEVLLFRDQLVGPARPVIYDQVDRRDPDSKVATDLTEVDLEAASLPASDDHFDLSGKLPAGGRVSCLIIPT